MKKSKKYSIAVLLSLSFFLLQNPNIKGQHNSNLYGSRMQESSLKENNLAKQSNVENFGFPYFMDNFDNSNDTSSLKNRGYKVYYRGTGPQGLSASWFQGTAAVFPAFNGPDSGYIAANFNAVTNDNRIDNWLVLPKNNVTFGDTLSFYSRSPTGSVYPDSIRVMYSSSGDSVPEAGTWTELGRFKVNTYGFWEKKIFIAPSPGVNARFAVRYTVVNGGPYGYNSDYIGIDAIALAAAVPQTEINSVELWKENNLIDSFNSIQAAYNAIEDPLTASHTIKLIAGYTGANEPFSNQNPVPLKLYKKTGAAQNKTVTIRPKTDNQVISINKNINNALIEIDGGCFIIIDGRAADNGKQIKFRLTNNTNTGGIIRMKNGASNNILRYLNCSVANVPFANVSNVNINIAQSAPGKGGNNDNVIDTCVIDGGEIGIKIEGTRIAVPLAEYLNERNKIFRSIIRNCTRTFIDLSVCSKDNTVSKCRLYSELERDVNSSFTGISISGIGNQNVDKNFIYGLSTSNTQGKIYGIYSSPLKTFISNISHTTNIYLANNLIDINDNNALKLFGIYSTSSFDFPVPYSTKIFLNTVQIRGLKNNQNGVEVYGIFEDIEKAGSEYSLQGNISMIQRTGGNNDLKYIANVISAKPNINILAEYNRYNTGNIQQNGYYHAKWKNTETNKTDEYFKMSKPNEKFVSFNYIKLKSVTNQQQLTDNINSDTYLEGPIGGDIFGESITGLTTDILDNVRDTESPYRGASEGIKLKRIDIRIKLESHFTNQDRVRIELRNSANPYNIASVCSSFIDSAGVAKFYFGDSISAGPASYYIVVRHMNSVETWSSSPQSFTGNPGYLFYDFTSSQSQAFGNNMIFKNGKWCIYSGDVNQDGLVDLTDLSLVDNDAGNYETGYLTTDLNGDELVDINDVSVVDNNSLNYVTVKNPINGNFSVGKNQIETHTDNNEQSKLNNENNSVPEITELNDNYPNPFNPETVIRYRLAVSSFVSLKVFDISGREIATLVNEKQNAGIFSLKFDGKNLPSGTYFYKIVAGDFSQVKRMILLK